jgi:hypothetical protein
MDACLTLQVSRPASQWWWIFSIFPHLGLPKGVPLDFILQVNSVAMLRRIPAN